ncbi:putative oxysterol-binding protein 1 [Schistosoma mansoni]|uniref:putative oxysterol-binding protein 1 n=2 Tax=Schistosoma mansoni TaxID=6183 RepID=UPI0001A640D9|nr:putative oxysterol-binding protein 1 [Schistosoma mansoni]|eukprot:XP_018652029.1 putative oxysterol-binding protein 1 [Schistosoma mansoni]
MDLSLERDCMKGYLYKWTNYLKGYQKRWFVLQNGLLSYYRNPAEMAHTCRGTIKLADATVKKIGTVYFEISNSSAQKFHIKANSESEQLAWLSALSNSKTAAVALRKQGYDSDAYADGYEDDDDYKTSSTTDENGIRFINDALVKLEAHVTDLERYQLTMNRKGEELRRSVGDVESARDPTELLQRFNLARERATVFKVASMAMVNSCSEFTHFTRGQFVRWQRIFNHQNERCALLEQMIEQLAKQLRQLECLTRQNNPQSTVTLGSGGGTVSSSLNIKSVSRPLGQAVRVQHLPHTEAHPQEENVTSSLDIAHDTTTSDVSKEYSNICADKSLKASEKHIISLESSAHHFPHSREFIQQHSSQHNEDTSDDDFYDAEEANSEFSITLPDLSPNESKNNGNKISRKTCGNLAGNKSNDNQTGLSNSQDEDSVIPAGSDIADEYESDVGFTDDEADEYADQNSQSNQFGKLREARVIQPRSRQCGSRPGTLVPSGDGQMTQDIPTTEESNSRDHSQADSEPDVIKKRLPIVRRLSIPPKPNISLNLWSIMKNCIGKELTKIPMPVSHHPPACALHCESNAWYCWFDFSMTTKFRGKYLQINPVGTCHLVFRRTGHHYTWHKIPLTVHNIIVGRLWIDNSGEMDIINHNTGEKCHLSYKPYSYFSNDKPRRVTGAVLDKSGDVRYVLNGTWDDSLEYAPVVSTRHSRNGKPVLETGPARVLWQSNPLPPDAERMYCFTRLALQLNEPEEDVCPTDSRLRPDQRLMEAGRWDEANRAKVELEELQRQRRRQMAAELAAQSLASSKQDETSDTHSKSDSSVSEQYNSQSSPSVSNFLDIVDSQHKPLWFTKEFDQFTNKETYIFTGKYWEHKLIHDWSMCPKIY